MECTPPRRRRNISTKRPASGYGLAVIAGVEVHLSAAGLLQRETPPLAQPLQHAHHRLPVSRKQCVVVAGDEKSDAHAVLETSPVSRMETRLVERCLLFQGKVLRRSPDHESVPARDQRPALRASL